MFKTLWTICKMKFSRWTCPECGTSQEDHEVCSSCKRPKH
jgi:rubrerythrin